MKSLRTGKGLDSPSATDEAIAVERNKEVIVIEDATRFGWLARMGTFLLAATALVVVACSPPDDASDSQTPTPMDASLAESELQEATSLLGEPLLRNPPRAEVQRDFEERLLAAKAELAAQPDSPDALIWVGRRTAYLGHYQEAIDIFTRGIERFPGDPRFLRHRGHRYLSTRQIPAAIEDFSQAYALIQGTEDQVEPDGMPNAQGVPTSTLHSNIRYHLGLAHYLQGDFQAALPLYQEDVELASNSDMGIASTYWLYLTLRRLGQDADAARVLAEVDPNLELIENFDYHRLLLYFAGSASRSELLGEDAGDDETLPGLKSATVSYGVATFDLVEGHEAEADALYRRILEGPQWSAFGYLSAEAELARR